MKIEVNLRKKYFFSLLAILIVLSGVLVVYAYNSSPAVPSSMGHSANELEVTLTNGTIVNLQTAVSNGWIGNSSGVGSATLGICKTACFNSGAGCDIVVDASIYNQRIFDCNALFPGYPVVGKVQEDAAGAVWFVSKISCCALNGGSASSTTPISTFDGGGRTSYNYVLPSGSIGGFACNSGYVVSAIHQNYNGQSYFIDYVTCSPVPFMNTSS